VAWRICGESICSAQQGNSFDNVGHVQSKKLTYLLCKKDLIMPILQKDGPSITQIVALEILLCKKAQGQKST